MKEKFQIKGMSCSSCVSHVEKAVGKLEGVKEVQVSLLSNNMQVQFEENKLTKDKIIEAVKEAGYEASVDSKKNQEKNKTNLAKEEIKEMKNRVWISFLFLIPLMYISMYPMLEENMQFLVPEIVTKLFSGTQNAIFYAFTQMLLLLPILYVNRKYFFVGLKMLKKRTPNMDSLIAIGSLAATIYGIIAIYQIGYGLGRNDHELVMNYTMDIYFESAGTILTLITLGKYLETKSKGKTSEAIDQLLNLAPKTAIVLQEGKEVTIRSRRSKKG